MRRRALASSVAVGLLLALGVVSAGAAAPSRVAIPHLRGELASAYGRLHALGLRVAIPAGASFDSLSPPQVVGVVPRAGRRVRMGSVVMLFLARAPARSSAKVSRLGPRRRVPRLVGGTVGAADQWALGHRLEFKAYLAPLRGGFAPRLLDNYVVTRQRLEPGRRALAVWGTPRPPLARTRAAQAITLNTAALAGTVNPQGEQTTYYFEYGPTRAYGHATRVQSAGWGNTPVRVGAALGGLAPAAGYHYELVARSRAGTTRGADLTLTTAGYYQNPVWGATVLPDPFILDEGGAHSDYWAYGTGSGFPVLHSSDLVHWTAEGTALSARPSWVVSTGNWDAWAPSVVQTSSPCPGTATNKCYIMYYTGLGAQPHVHCIGVATSPFPDGPFTDQGPLDLASGATPGMPEGCGDASGTGNIDPSPFIDSSGQAYLYVSTDNACAGGSCTFRPTISVIPLTADLLHAAGPRVALFSGNPGTWESAGLSTPTVEGPAMEFHDGTYYLFYSGGNWREAYGMGYATSASPTGPFTKSPSNPILSQTPTVRGPGGGDRLVTGPRGGLWIAYAARSTTSGRTLRIDPFSWVAGPGGPDRPSIAGPTSTPQAIQP